MGEYLLYSDGILFDGIYDDCLLIKEAPASLAALGSTAAPYEGAKPMRFVDLEDGETISRLIGAVRADLSGCSVRRSGR